jgi:hypothetical protein
MMNMTLSMGMNILDIYLHALIEEGRRSTAFRKIGIFVVGGVHDNLDFIIAFGPRDQGHEHGR